MDQDGEKGSSINNGAEGAEEGFFPLDRFNAFSVGVFAQSVKKGHS